MSARLRAALVGSLLLTALAAPPAAAQWAPLPFDPDGTLLEEGFLVLHENGDGIHAFSAVRREWTQIADPGPSIVGAGDWVVALRQPSPVGQELVGWSARRNRRDSVTALEFTDVRVEDDVVFAVALFEDGNWYACGFSGVTARWEVEPLGFEPIDAQIATSRFVAGVASPLNQTLYGFAARTGKWALFPTGVTLGIPEADGNTLTCPVIENPVNPQMAAFSGVRGNWAISPPYLFDFVNSPQLDHNVAYVRAVSAGGFRGSGYSAYAGAWTTSFITHSLLPSTSEAVSDNVVLISDENFLVPVPRFEAFGSRPSTWDPLPGNWGGEYLDEDYVLVRSGTQPLIAGYSGLCKGQWVQETISTEASAVALPSPDHIGVMREPIPGLPEGRLWVFRPSSASWEPPFDPESGAGLWIADLEVDVEGSIDGAAGPGYNACTDRWGGWRPESVPNAAWDHVVGGSAIAHKVTASGDPALVGAIWIFDERCDRWPGPFDPGPDQPLIADRNVVLSFPAPGENGRVWGYSVQRGDWSDAPGAVLPWLIAPRVEENVTWFVAGGEQPLLWAFGSPNVGHVDYQWPNGTEYHTSGDPDQPAVPAPLFAYTVLGIPGATQQRPLFSGGVDCPGSPIGGASGLLCLDAPVVPAPSYLPLTGSDGLEELFASLASPIAPCRQIWLQPLTLDFVVPEIRLERRCDPAWIF